MTLTLAALLALTSATVTIDGPWLVAIAALMGLSVAANVYLVVHVRRVEHRLARVLGEVDALRTVLRVRDEPPPQPHEDSGGDKT